MDEPIYHAKPSPRIAASARAKASQRRNTMDAVKKVIHALLKQRWALFMPQNVLDAHRAGVLEWWGVAYPNEERNKARLSEVGITAFGYWNNKGLSVPPLPEPTITDVVEWNSVIRHFGIGTGGRYKIIEYGNLAHEIIFVRVGCYTQGQDEELVWRLLRLRNKFGITWDRLDSAPRSTFGTFIVVQKTYLPEQIRKLRRRLTDQLCKSTGDVIRASKAFGLVGAERREKLP